MLATNMLNVVASCNERSRSIEVYLSLIKGPMIQLTPTREEIVPSFSVVFLSPLSEKATLRTSDAPSIRAGEALRKMSGPKKLPQR